MGIFKKALTSRKFLFCAYVLGWAPVLLWCGKLDSTAFVALVTIVSSSYILGQSLVDKGQQ